MVTVMMFDSLDDVIAFQGEHNETAYVPDAAQQHLQRWDRKSAHHVVEEARSR